MLSKDLIKLGFEEKQIENEEYKYYILNINGVSLISNAIRDEVKEKILIELFDEDDYYIDNIRDLKTFIKGCEKFKKKNTFH